MLLLEVLLGDGARRYPHRGLPRRGAAAAAVVARAVFLLVAVVGMTRAELLLDIAVVLGTLIGVFDQQANGRTRGLALEDAGENFHRIGLAPGSGEFRGARFAAVEIALEITLLQLDARRAAVNHAAQGQAVTLAKGGNGEQFTYAVARH